MTVLVAVWLWFAAVLGSPVCMPQPNMTLIPDVPGSVGRYWPGGSGHIQIEQGLGRLTRSVTVHELAHHHWYTCNIDDRRVGDRFLTVTGHAVWTQQAKEAWASTFTWVLTGHDDRSGLINRHAAPLFLRLIDHPSRAMLGRMGYSTIPP